MNKIFHTASYFNPFAKNPCSEREALVEFGELSTKSKAKIVALTILAFIGTLFILGAGAVATFRIWTHKFSKIDANSNTDPTITKTEDTFEKAIKKPDRTPEKTISTTQSTQSLPPIGFSNYGNTCWFGSGLQSLLASEHFEEIVRGKLEKSERLEKFKNKNSVWFDSIRPETDEEFSQRLKAQTALIRVIELRKKGNAKETNIALKELHLILLEIKTAVNETWIASIGKTASSHALPGLLGYLYPDIKNECHPDRFLSCCGINEDNDVNIEYYNNELFGNGIPKIICTRILQRDFVNENYVIGPESKFTFSKDGKSFSYRIVAVVEALPNHYISYVRNQEEWYRCNDSKVSKISKDKLEIVGRDLILFELCE